VLVSKYADHLPLYRQAQMIARQGVDLDRSTLADWVGRAAWLLRPVHEQLFAKLKTSGKLFADETTAAVLDPGRGRTKTGQLWTYARDDRPWRGTDSHAYLTDVIYASSTITQTAKSTNSCRGLTPPLNSNTWPENSAYA
jgi:transposase